MKSKLQILVAAMVLGAGGHGFPANIHYVDLNSPNPTAPYVDWATAARRIQDAIDVAGAGDGIVVTNGMYVGGVTVTAPLMLVSVNGPLFTVINGGGTNQSVSLTNGASLYGFTVTNGVADSGGGVWCAASATITNCLITGNWANVGGGVFGGTISASTLTRNFATNSGGGVSDGLVYNSILTGNETVGPLGAYGGGAAQSTLYKCLIATNSASVRIGLGGSGGGAAGGALYQCILLGNQAREGGGIDGSTLYNCTVVGNGAEIGGGTYFATAYNSIVYYNFYGENYISEFDHSCTTGIQIDDGGNISVEPGFIDLPGGNLRLQTNSPCINSGNNAYVYEAADLNGNPRVVSGTVDIGAYEFQGRGSLISYAWLQQYGLPTDGSADFIDSDSDGMKNWQEWVCGTDPTNGLSVLRLLSAIPATGQVTITWQSVSGVNYFLERSAAVAAPFTLIATNIAGQIGTTSYADTNASGPGPFFYRVGVRSL